MIFSLVGSKLEMTDAMKDISSSLKAFSRRRRFGVPALIVRDESAPCSKCQQVLRFDRCQVGHSRRCRLDELEWLWKIA